MNNNEATTARRITMTTPGHLYNCITPFAHSDGECMVKVTSGRLAGLIVKVIDQTPTFLVVTYDTAEGHPVRSQVTLNGGD